MQFLGDALGNDPLDPRQPAATNECDLDLRGRRFYNRSLSCSRSRTRGGRRFEIDREQARQCEHENDEWDAHSGRSGFAERLGKPASAREPPVFVPARSWLGSDGAGGEAAAAQLVRRYLAAFGPATRADVAQWAGLPSRVLEPAFAALELRRLRDEQGRELLDLPRAPLPSPETPAQPRFLPRWDNLLLSHDGRRRVLPEEYRKR